ncbi:MAG: hypothetical protein HY646_15810 [Acidobacteria bacterium]|nr:hypothetical protein [Acidobacteriota bacterium]
MLEGMVSFSNETSAHDTITRQQALAAAREIEARTAQRKMAWAAARHFYCLEGQHQYGGTI